MYQPSARPVHTFCLTWAGILLGLLLGVSPIRAQTYYVYANAESEDEVALISFDGKKALVEKTIPVGNWPTEIEGPHGIYVEPDGSHWYLTLAHGTPYGRLLRYTTESDALVGEVALGHYPATISYSEETGLLYIVNFNLHGDHEPSTISIVEPETMTELDQVQTGVMPHGSRLSPDGTFHYSVAMMSGMLYEMDAHTFEITRTLSLTSQEQQPHSHGHHEQGPTTKPTWAVHHPSLPLIYIANNGSQEIVEVHRDHWEITRRFDTEKGPYNLDVSPDGRLLVVTHKGAASIGIIDLESGMHRGTRPTSAAITHGVVISPDNRYAFVTSEGIGGDPGMVDIFDLKQLERVASVAIGKQAGGIAFWKQSN